MPSSVIKRLYSAFDLALLGNLVFDVTNDGDGKAYTITLSAAKYFTGFSDGASRTDVLTALKAALNAAADAAASASDWEITWSNTTLAVTISEDGPGNFSATLNAVAQNVLGMAASLSGATSQVSTKRPYYVIAPSLDGRAFDTYPKPEKGRLQGKVTDAGEPFRVGPTTRLTSRRWTQQFEPKAAVWTDELVAAVPWTWQRFWDHHLYGERFVVIRHTNASITYATEAEGPYALHDDAVDFDPQESHKGVDVNYDLDFACYIVTG